MPKPSASTLPEFYKRYIDPLEYDELIPALISSGNESIDLFKSIPEASGNYRYEEGKWSIKQVIQHIMDAERVFCYRALTFSRGDDTRLPGFDENSWAAASLVSDRKLYKLIEAYANLRASTVDLFGSFTGEMLQRTGDANGIQVDVLTLGFLIVGHEAHHRRVLLDRYFQK
ncbi:MAG: DinB family protein [Cytophagales bacterium]|nr:DinB family protein [Cytophagales bacterium]